MRAVAPVWEGTQALQPVWRPGPEGQPDELVAEGFAVDVAMTARVAAQEVCWTERRWLARSRAYTQAQEKALERRLAKAEAALREAFPFETAPRYLIRDRDGIYGREVRRCLVSLGLEEVVTAPRSPWQNPYCERLIGSIRRELLDHVLVLNERHLRQLLRWHCSGRRRRSDRPRRG